MDDYIYLTDSDDEDQIKKTDLTSLNSLKTGIETKNLSANKNDYLNKEPNYKIIRKIKPIQIDSLSFPIKITCDDSKIFRKSCTISSLTQDNNPLCSATTSSNSSVEIFNNKLNQLDLSQQFNSTDGFVQFDKTKSSESLSSMGDTIVADNNIGADPKKALIKRLEILLKRINGRIRKLEEEDQSLEEMNDCNSAYLLLDKYKQKFVEVWDKLCKISATSSTSICQFDQKIKLSDGSYPRIRSAVACYINKCNEFPDYFDVYSIVEKCNIRFKLNKTKAQLDSISRDIFLEVGNKLQKRKKYRLRLCVDTTVCVHG